MKDNYKIRQRYIQLFFIVAYLILLFKAIQIQLLDTSYQDRARTTAIDKYILYPSRGLILDRNEKLLVNNNAMYDLKVTYNQIDPKMDTMRFCKLLNIDVETFKKNLNKNFRSARYSKSVPFVFLSKISSETYAGFQESMYEFPGFAIQLRNVRGYPHKSAAHVLGYLSEVNQAQLDKYKDKYVKGDYIGATGLEKSYEDALKGKKGVKFVLKDNLGREVGSYKSGKLDSAAISGNDLVTTLDIDLQEYAELLMSNKSGSIVAIEPKSGEILSMVSAPYYDPNLLTINRNRGAAFNELLQDSLKPFLDRSLMAKYPPGSIFKTVVSLIAMHEEVLYPGRPMTCNGTYYYKTVPFGCHQHPAPYNVARAIQHSCNSYFYQTIRDIIDKYGFYNPHQGLDSFDYHLANFGIGKKLNVDLPNELEGNIPTSAYYDKLYPKVKGSWKSPTVMSIGIGQGEIEMTTLQMANLAAIMANRGTYTQPHLGESIIRSDGSKQKFEYEVFDSGVDPKFYESVIDGMQLAVESGTATNARVSGTIVCGKTGTSQNPHGKDHSVFFAFAPRDNPEIAIAVYVEHGVWGARYAAPIAGLMIEKYLNKEISPSKAYLEEKMINTNLHIIP